MHRVVTVVVAVAVLVGAVPAAATLADGTPTETAAEPGETFAGVVGVQGAEVGNEVAQRSLDQRLAAAESNASKAAVVAAESERLEQRLAELEAKIATLKTAYENGSISRGEYHARLAPLASELRSIERLANQTADVAADLPDAALESHGTSASEVRAVAQQANTVGGKDVADAARSVAGGEVGAGLGAPPSDNPGNSGEARDDEQPGNAENATSDDPGNASENAAENAGNDGNAADGAGDAANESERSQSGSTGDDGTTNESETTGSDRAADGTNAGNEPAANDGNSDDAAGSGDGHGQTDTDETETEAARGTTTGSDISSFGWAWR